MARYIELDALVAEINKRIIDAPINNIGHQRVWAYNDVKDIVNTLEVKEVNLEEELKYYCKNYYNCDYPKQLEEENCSKVMPHIVSAAKHFFKLGMAVSNKVQKGEEV